MCNDISVYLSAEISCMHICLQGGDEEGEEEVPMDEEREEKLRELEQGLEEELDDMPDLPAVDMV